MKFALVVGHTAESPGARAVAPLDCYEYDYNKGLAALVACDLMDDGIQSEIFFRDKIGINGAYSDVNTYNPAGVIELHFNAAALGDIRGTETLYVPKVAGSDRLAIQVHAAICVALSREGRANRGIKQVDPSERGYVNLTLARCPSILIEPFFGDCSFDSALGFSHKPELSRSIAKGISAFMRSQDGLN